MTAATGDSAGESADRADAKALHGRRRIFSRRGLVWLAAIASQVVLIGGVFAWSYYLAKDAIGSQPANTTAVITVWVSDPGWDVAPELEVSQHSWLLTLSTQQGSSFGLSHPDAEAVVVLWGNAELSNPHPTCYLVVIGLNCSRPMSSAAPRSYQQVQVPQEQADFYVEDILSANVPGFPGPTIPAQVFTVTARNYYGAGADRRSVFPVAGQPSSVMETATSTGWSAFVPSAVDGGTSGSCSPAPTPLPAAIDAVVGPASQGWFGMSCVTPSIELITAPGEQFSDSTVPPTSTDNGTPTWTDQPQAPDNTVLPQVGGFWVDVADPAIAAAAQRDLFFAGVLAGIAGGLLAGWFAAAVTFVVKRSIAPATQVSKAPEQDPPPKAAR